MPISLPSTSSPLGLRSTYATDEENAATAAAMEQEALAQNTAVGRGLSRGLYNLPASFANVAGQVVEPLSPTTAQPMFDWAAQQTADAQRSRLPTDITDTDQIHSLADAGNYVGGMIGENLPNALATIPLGLAASAALPEMAGAGLMGVGARAYLGQSIASMPQNMGEQVGKLRADPTVMNSSTPTDRLLNSAGHGVVGGLMEGAGDALLLGRLGGAGAAVKNVFNDGVGASAKNALGHVAKAIPEAAITEGVPEALQERSGQVFHSMLNPNRGTSKDAHDLKESFFGGWAAGGGHSVVGRGADVAWAQGRGATEAIRNLISPKALPANLINSDDQSIVGWDKQDDAQRNETAKGLADSILNSEASQSLKEAASSFYEKASNGVSDAWSSLSETLSDNEHVKHATGRLDNFLDAVKKANKNAFSEEKNNAESSPEDQAMFDQFTQHLDPRGVAARDTEKKSALFQGVKGALTADAWHELPWHDLEDEFGTIGRATDAVIKMRENMVRAGQLEHDDEFGKLLEASTKDGQLGERAMMDVVHRYGKEYIGRKPDDRELREMVRGIRNAMQGRSTMKPEMVKAFDAEMNKSFGEANAAKVMQALGPKNVDQTEFETDDGKGNITGDTVNQPKPRFVGSATKSALKTAGSSAGAKETIADHGGFWRLDMQSAKPEEMAALKTKIAETEGKIVAAKKAGRTTKGHAANLSKMTKQLEGMRTAEHVAKDRARMSATSRSLRNGKGAEAHFVKHLTPLEYAEMSGISKEVIAKHLGTTVDGLEGHAARMIMAEQRQLEKDKLSLDHDDLANMTDRTTQAMKNLPRSVDLKGDQAERVKAALKLTGRQSRVAMEAEGLGHGQRMDDKVANRLLNNWDHGGNGIFTVHTTNGKYKMSAQVLIETIRKRAVGEMGDASAVKAFETGIGSIMAMDGFVKITVDNIWGRQQAPLKNKVVIKKDGNKKGVANAKFGQFGPYFKLEPGLLLNEAEEAATRKGSEAEKEDLALVAEYEALETRVAKLQAESASNQKAGVVDEKLEEALDATLARMEQIEDEYNEIEAARAMYAGEDQSEAVPGSKDATDKDITPTEHTDEQVRDYNDDGSHKHPPGRPAERGDRTQHLKFNGVTLNLRPGVSAKDLTGAARKLVSTVRRVREIVGNTSTADIALNLVGQAAAANKAGDTVARDALLAMASDKVVESIVDEMLIAQESKDRARYADLKDLGAEHIALSKKYKANSESMDEYAKSYLPFLGKKPSTAQEKKFAPERWSHHSQFLATLDFKTDEEILADGMARKARLESLEALGSKSEKLVELIGMMREEQSLARDELRARKAGEKAQKIEEAPKVGRPDPVAKMPELRAEADRAEREATGAKTENELEGEKAAAEGRAEREAKAETQEQGFEQALSDVEQLKKNLGDTGTALRAAYAALKQSYVEGKVNKDLVPQLRAALAAFRKAVGDAARIVVTAVQRFIKEYQEAKVSAQEEVATAEPEAKLNSEGSAPTGQGVTAKDMVDIKDYITKVLGPKVELRLSKNLGGNSASWVRLSEPALAKGMTRLYRGEGTKNTKGGDWFSTDKAYAEKYGTLSYIDVTQQELANHFALGHHHKVNGEYVMAGNTIRDRVSPMTSGEALIKIAVNAANPLSKAHHEAMHEFFQRLMDDGSPAAEVLRTAANNPLVTRQIEQFFHKDANYAAIKAALAADEHERVAYMFQLWAAGKLMVGPKTESWFQKIVSFLREVSGVLSNDQKAEAIMAHFHDGRMADSNAVAEVLANDPKLVQDLVERSDKLMMPLAHRLSELTYTSQNMLTESGVKSFEKIGRLFSTETGRKNEAMSFFDAKTMKTNQMNDRLVQILREDGVDEKDVVAALDGLQQGKTSQDPKIARIQSRIRKMLDQIHNYMTEKQADGKPLIDVKKINNYFPRAWDVGHIADNKAQFVAMLQADHFKNTNKVMSESIATGIADKLIADRGAEPVNEGELENGYTPFMAAANKRVLDFITDPKFAEFQQKDMGHILSTYIAQAVHRAEYTRRFGKNGTGLRSMVHDGVGEVVGPEWATARSAAETTLKNLKAQYKKAGMTPDKITEKLHEKGYRYGEVQTAHIQAELTSPEAKKAFDDFEPKLRRSVRAIMAMEGTLGADIDPKLRNLGSSLIVYENLRLLGLSLFSQVIDPLGVLVRGGTLNDAFETFKRGITGTVAAWKGTPMEDRMSKLAMQLGIVDAGGMINSQGNAYASVYLGKMAQKINDRLFRVNGVEGFSQGTRVGAMMAAISFIKAHSALPSEHSERWLAELNLSAADVKLVGDELDYSDPKIQQAIFRWVETAILRPNASMRPAWASDPHWALIFHMKQFTYAMQKVLLERIRNEIKHNNYDPAIAMVLTYVPAMMAADFLRGLASNGGEEPPWKRKWTFSDYLSDGVQRAGLLGVPQFALDTAKWGPGELAGPAAEQVLRAGERLNKDVRRDLRLDDVAALTGSQIDIQKAEDFNGVTHAAKRTLRDALPVSSLTKRYVFDEIAGM